jgi:hypothetical protein
VSQARISAKGLGRIKAAVESKERGALFHSTRPAARRHFPAATIKHAIVTTTISAATPGTPNEPGSGEVTLYDFDLDTGLYTAGATEITAWNDAAGSIAVGTEVKVCLQDGQWFVIWYLC